jgi:DNA-binding NtrC family response regulator
MGGFIMGTDAQGRSTVTDARVLVVDDEPMVGDMLGETLQSWGLEVTVLNHPIEAEHWFLQDPSRVDLVLTDLTMPKITGLELAQRLTLVRPDLVVVLFSGQGLHISEEQAARSGISATISKPVEPAALLDLLRAHLPDTHA